jgi:8-oxo-dGTP pyrophosphatase MutT (NUDIX family)
VTDAATSITNPDLPQAANVVLEKNGLFLAVTLRHQALLAFPGGKREPGESALQNAIRELEEETGVRTIPADLTPLCVLVCEPDNATRPHRVDIFAARWQPHMGEPAQQEDGILTGWVPLGDILEFNAAAAYFQELGAHVLARFPLPAPSTTRRPF